MIEFFIVIPLLLLATMLLVLMIKLNNFMDVSLGTSNNIDKNLVSAFWHKIINNNNYIALFIVFTSFIIVSLFGIITNPKIDDEFFSGVFVELLGFLFDTLILVLLFTFLSSKRERNLNIENNITLLEELANRNDPTIHVRVKTTIERLNRDGKYDLKLSNIFMCNQSINNIILNGASLYSVDFTKTFFVKGKFIGMVCSNSKFNSSHLFEADFKNSKIQHTSFIHCKLRGANFSNASLSNVIFLNCNLENVNFTGAHIFNVNLQYARVEENFIQKIQHLGLADAFEIDKYELKTENIGTNGQSKVYFLLRKTVL